MEILKWMLIIDFRNIDKTTYTTSILNPNNIDIISMMEIHMPLLLNSYVESVLL